MEFKVGDKVRIVKSKVFTDEIGWVCEVIVVSPSSSSFACRILHKPTNWECLMFSWEIEKIPSYTKGEQLLFSFMNE